MKIHNDAWKHIEQLKKLVDTSNIQTDSIITKEFNHEFSCTAGKSRVKVQVYFGKKGIKTIIQGDSQSELFKTIKNIIDDQQSFHFDKQNIKEPEEYIGSDEAGKGDFFGPLVVAAVYVNNITKTTLYKIGIRDSKELSDNQIKLFAREIKSLIKNNFVVVRINPDKYNNLYKKFNNLNKILDWAHSKAIENLLDNTKCEYVITDKFGKSDLSLVSKFPDVNFISETKAEKYVAVAAASILARASMLEWFDSQLKKGLTLPKGASNQVDNYTKILLKKIDKAKLSTIAKLHFKTYYKVTTL